MCGGSVWSVFVVWVEFVVVVARLLYYVVGSVMLQEENPLNHLDKQKTIDILQEEVYKIPKWAHSKRLTSSSRKLKQSCFTLTKK